MANELSTTLAKIRQRLKDTGTEFSTDNLKHHIDAVLEDISLAHPYVVNVTQTDDGIRDYSISGLANFASILEVVKAEYKVDKDPAQYRNVERYGNTVYIDITDAPASGESIYLWCNEIHTITDSATTLDTRLQRVLIDGVVAAAARDWLNQMRSDIVPAANTWYHKWANEAFALYKSSLASITIPKAHEFYSRS